MPEYQVKTQRQHALGEAGITVDGNGPAEVALAALVLCGAETNLGDPIRLIVETETQRITYDAHVQMRRVEVTTLVLPEPKTEEGGDAEPEHGEQHGDGEHPDAEFPGHDA